MKASHGVNYISQYSNHSSEKHCASPPSPNVSTRSLHGSEARHAIKFMQLKVVR